MNSPALEIWRSGRVARLDRLLAAHPEAGTSPNDPLIAQEWTQAIVVRLGSEFQGFCRDLYDDAVLAILETVTVASSPLRSVLTNGLTDGRGLDRRSADPRTISDDFDRLGSDLWVSLASCGPAVARGWREGLAMLHRARNGVAHDDLGAIAAVEAAGWPLRLATVRRWRNLLDELTNGVDACLGRDIAVLIGKNPWRI